MSPETPTDPNRQRRRRHTRERQAVVFGLLLGVMAVSAFGAAAVYTGSLDLPFLSRGFSSPEPTGLAAANSPCPPDGAMPVAYGEVTVNVFNGTNRVGLAGDTANALAQRGFVIGNQGNAAAQGYSTDYNGTALIQFGTQGVAQAYTVAAQFETPLLVLDNREDATVDVLVGPAQNGLIPTADVQLAADQPIAAPEGCVALDQVSPQPQPTPSPAAEATEGDDAVGDDAEDEEPPAEG